MYISHIYGGIYTLICMHLVHIPAISTVIRHQALQRNSKPSQAYVT